MTIDQTISLGPASTLGTRASDVVIPVQLGSVRLIHEIGRGGMGTVWLGRDELLGRDVAVKFLLNASSGSTDPGFRSFLDGARAAAAVRHAGLTTVYHADLVQNVPYLVMEYIDGPTLSELLRKTGPLNLRATVGVFDTMAAAIAELHERGIVHRDIKPSNVLLDSSGRVFVTDFGLACERTGAGPGTVSSGMAGTAAYMAPETFDGLVSPRSDVYALGVTGFELLTGLSPFAGDSVSQVRDRHLSEPLPIDKLSDRGIAEPVAEVLQRATHKDAMFRYKTARQFLRALIEATPDGSAAGTSVVLAGLVSQCRRGPLDAAPLAEAPAEASYYSRLATLAATKRGSSQAASAPPASPELRKAEPVLADGAQPPIAAPSTAPTDLAGPRRSIAADVPCCICQYNLRGLSDAGTCPECGNAVAGSTGSDRLLFANRDWLASLRRGLLLVNGSIAALLGTVLLAPLIAGMAIRASTTTSGDWVRRFGQTLGDIVLAIGCASAILACVGLVLTTRREPDPAMNSDPSNGRMLARVAMIAAVLLMLITAFISVTPVRIPSTAFGIGYFASLLIAAQAFVAYLKGLARRFPDADLVRLAGYRSVVIAICAGGWLLMVILGASVEAGSDVPRGAFILLNVVRTVVVLLLLTAAVYTMGLLLRFCRSLKQALDQRVDPARVFADAPA